MIADALTMQAACGRSANWRIQLFFLLEMTTSCFGQYMRKTRLIFRLIIRQELMIPLQKIRTGMNRIRHGDYDYRIEYEENDLMFDYHVKITTPILLKMVILDFQYSA